jgi:hypothetical protein
MVWDRRKSSGIPSLGAAGLQRDDLAILSYVGFLTNIDPVAAPGLVGAGD